MFAHLHVHSSYSFLEGLGSPAELARLAAEHGLAALALTDHRTLTGAVEFYDACLEAGVRPILGLELDVQPHPAVSAYTQNGGRLVLLAENLDGWSSLCRLSSLAHADPGVPAPLSCETLASHAAGLVCLTGGTSGLCRRLILQGEHTPAAEWLGILRQIFPGRLYVELNLHTPADLAWVRPLAEMAQVAGLPALAAHNIHYLRPEQAALQRTASAIAANRPAHSLEPDQVDAAQLAPEQAFFIPPHELAKRFADFPAALANIQETAERCQVELPVGQARFPDIQLPRGRTAIEELRLAAYDGAMRLYSSQSAADGQEELPLEVETRLEHELQVIADRHFEAIFLVMEKIVRFTRSQGIPIASRGSASSSLVAHCLGITTPDPLRLNLYFERFLNPARAKPPDIDTDLCSRRRDEVIDFVYHNFGADRVAMVGTINRFRRRSALREAAKAHGLSAAEISALVERLPQRWYGPPDRFLPPEDPYAEVAGAFPAPRYAQILADAKALIGLPRHLSIHPGGMVIAPHTLTDLVPTMLAAKGIVITQFDLDAVERLGLVKIDLLGIRGLTVLGDVAGHLSQSPEGAPASVKTAPRSRARQEASTLALESIPESDAATSALIEAGRTIGCFQIESPGMRATLREIRASTVDDLLAALALYRPGPLTGGLKDRFVARYRGQEAAAYLHPALKDLLGDTYGVILYQEQVLRIAHELAGLSLADSDLLRRAMSHFDPGKQMRTLQERFQAGAWERHKIQPEISEQIWQLMAAFAGYGFPKAHAASYAWVAWQSAWCKTHHPAVFMAAVLANWGGYYSQSIYLTEARRLGLNVRPPHVNHSQSEFSVQVVDGSSALFMGLNQVRELTHRTQERIRRERPFRSFEDFLARVDPRPVEAQNLTRAGALEGLGTIPSLLRRLERGGWRRGQPPLFDLGEGFGQTTAAGPSEDWNLAQKADAQTAILGVSLAAHPLELYAQQIAGSGAVSIVEAAGRVGQRARVAGVRQTWRRSRARHGDYIYFMALEDLEGMIDVMIPAGVYARCRNALRTSGPYIVEGMVEYNEERGEPALFAEKIESVTANRTDPN